MQFETYGPIVAIAVLIALAYIVKFLCSTPRSRHMPSAYKPGLEQTNREGHIRDPVEFWREEIRRIVEKHGSPIKAANHMEHWIEACDFAATDDRELEVIHNYWRDISYWCGRVRIELSKLDPNCDWSPTEWTRLFNAFGRVSLRVNLAWSKRFRSHIKAFGSTER